MKGQRSKAETAVKGQTYLRVGGGVGGNGGLELRGDASECVLQISWRSGGANKVGQTLRCEQRDERRQGEGVQVEGV